ncbi:SCP-like protein [Aerococcus sp. Group 1]|uniref:G5 domain-containing protein n=1 Tax=Aerococcus urinae (strain CCUG 59500 / ACS-120-V-Col10a) TaxID=2976812 RepID=UPI000200F563|nr:G5 domain-containing protein [Aerococcus sp. Group 1]AEA01894.1 SCP-like protein [Aerococcus sp. Group 1]
MALVALGTPIVFAQDSNNQSLTQEQMTEILAKVNGTNSYQEWVANTVEEVKVTIEAQKGQNLDEYIIQWGDTLWAISQASGIPIDELVAINGIQNADLIYAGDTLKGVLNRIQAYAKHKEAQTVAITPQQSTNTLQVLTTEPVSVLPREVAETKVPTNHTAEVSQPSVSQSVKPIQEQSQTEESQPNHQKDAPVETVKEQSEPQVIDRTEETIKVTEGDQTDSQTTPSGVIEEQPATEGRPTEHQTDTNSVVERPEPTVKPSPEPSVPVVPTQPQEGNDEGEKGSSESVPLTPLAPATPIEEVQPAIVKRTDHSVRTTPIHFGFQRIADPNLEKGVEQVVQEGKDGVKTETIERVYENDQLISETVIATEVVDATPQIIHVGTKESAPEDTIEVKKVTTTESIPYKQVIKDNPSLEKGREALIQKGEEGQREIVEEVTYTNGKETSRKQISDQVVKEAVDEIIVRGTREETESVPLTPLTPATPIENEKTEPVITTKEESHTEAIPFETVRKENKNLEKGVEQVIQTGVNGEKTITEKVTFTDGKESNRELIREEVTKEPINQVVEYGTKEKVSSDPFGPTQGLQVGDAFNGGVVKDFIIRFPENILDLAKAKNESNAQEYYEKAKKPSEINYVGTAENGHTTYSPIPFNKEVVNLFNNTDTMINTVKLNEEFAKILNAERQSKGLIPLSYGDYLQEGADNRSQELAEYGDIRVNGKSHVRPHDGSSFRTAYDPTIRYGLSENSLLTFIVGNPYQLLSEKYLAEHAFNMWKESPGHYANMMNEDSKSFVFSMKIAPDKKGRGNLLIGTFSGDSQMSKEGNLFIHELDKQGKLKNL